MCGKKKRFVHEQIKERSSKVDWGRQRAKDSVALLSIAKEPQGFRPFVGVMCKSVDAKRVGRAEHYVISYCACEIAFEELSCGTKT